MTHTTADRVRGCLTGIATGDAIGKQTEMLSLDRIKRWYPNGIRGFEGVPGEVIPRYLGNAKREWRVGETTDDTERTIAVARAIIRDRRVSHASIGREMLGCTKCVHPGVASLWEFHRAGDASRVATRHDGCGAAIRIAPVGVLFRADPIDRLVEAAREASISTHGGSLAIAAAAATAAAVSAALDGAGSSQLIDAAERAAALAEKRWPGAAPPAMANAIRAVHDDLASTPALHNAYLASRWFPDRALTIVPLALGLAAVLHSSEDAILLAANVGGDSDSVASIAGGILGALHPGTVNQQWHEVVEEVNHHNLAVLAEELAGLRS